MSLPCLSVRSLSVPASDASLTSIVQHIQEYLGVLKHPNITNHVDIISGRSNSVYIVSEAYSRTLSAEILYQRHWLQDSRIQSIAFQILEALQYLHYKDVALGFLCPTSIYLDPQDNLRVGDIGYHYLRSHCSALPQPSLSACAPYISPELYTLQKERIKQGQSPHITSKDIHFSSDIWSFGVLMLECILGDLRFLGPSDSFATYLHIHHLLSISFAGKRLFLHSTSSSPSSPSTGIAHLGEEGGGLVMPNPPSINCQQTGWPASSSTPEYTVAAKTKLTCISDEMAELLLISLALSPSDRWDVTRILSSFSFFKSMQKSLAWSALPKLQCLSLSNQPSSSRPSSAAFPSSPAPSSSLSTTYFEMKSQSQTANLILEDYFRQKDGLKLLPSVLSKRQQPLLVRAKNAIASSFSRFSTPSSPSPSPSPSSSTVKIGYCTSLSEVADKSTPSFTSPFFHRRILLIDTDELQRVFTTSMSQFLPLPLPPALAISIPSPDDKDSDLPSSSYITPVKRPARSSSVSRQSTASKSPRASSPGFSLMDAINMFPFSGLSSPSNGSSDDEQKSSSSSSNTTPKNSDRNTRTSKRLSITPGRPRSLSSSLEQLFPTIGPTVPNSSSLSSSLAISSSSSTVIQSASYHAAKKKMLAASSSSASLEGLEDQDCADGESSASSRPDTPTKFASLDQVYGHKFGLSLAKNPLLKDTRLTAGFNQLLSDKEKDRSYQLSRIHLFRTLLLGLPATKDELVRQSRVDIPHVLRGEIWAALLGVEDTTAFQQWQSLDFSASTSSDRQISVDVPRCHQYHPMMASPQGHEKLKNLLKGWVMLQNNQLVYWQGLDSLCAPFLTLNFGCEWRALACLDKLVGRFVRDLFEADNSLAMEERLWLFEQLLSYHLPELSTHLRVIGFAPELYSLSWFLTLFAHTLPLEKIYRLWDALLLGPPALPVFVAVALLKDMCSTLLEMDFNSLMLHLHSALQFSDLTHIIADAILLCKRTPASISQPAFLHLSAAQPTKHASDQWNRVLSPEVLRKEWSPRLGAHDLTDDAMRSLAVLVHITTPEEYEQLNISSAIFLDISQPPSSAVQVLSTKRMLPIVLVSSDHAKCVAISEQLVRARFPYVSVLNGGVDALQAECPQMMAGTAR